MSNPQNKNIIILKKTKLGEMDLILSMLDDEGNQIRGVAKAARKPGNKRYGAKIEPFTIASAQIYKGKTLDNITQIKAIETNAKLRDDYVKSAYCYLACEFVDKVSSLTSISTTSFEMLSAYFSLMHETNDDSATLLTAAFILKLSSILGFMPLLKACSICGKEFSCLDELDTKVALYFDIVAGGLVCQQCHDKWVDLQNESDDERLARLRMSNPDTQNLPIKYNMKTMSQSFASWINSLIHSTFSQLVESSCDISNNLLHFSVMWASEHFGINLKSYVYLKEIIQ
ncbi:MAG: DNA repair protein RecO [Coriobacteriales bacterium]|nr:DNA repair protein RecO [Coriobacteriales bacterium]